LISGSGIKKYTNLFLAGIFTNDRVGIIRGGFFYQRQSWNYS